METKSKGHHCHKRCKVLSSSTITLKTPWHMYSSDVQRHEKTLETKPNYFVYIMNS